MSAFDEKSTRGEGTRGRLLEAGLKLYATLGYSAVTTRLIAEEAGVNHSAIGFHFRGKEGLYQAVITNMIQTFAKKCCAFITHINEYFDKSLKDRRVLQRMIEVAFLDFMQVTIENRRYKWMSMLLQRELLAPSDVFERMYIELGEPFLRDIEKIIQKICPEDEEQIIHIKACCIISQLTSLSRDQTLLTRKLGTDAYAQPNNRLISKIVASGMCGILGV